MCEENKCDRPKELVIVQSSIAALVDNQKKYISKQDLLEHKIGEHDKKLKEYEQKLESKIDADYKKVKILIFISMAIGIASEIVSINLKG